MLNHPKINSRMHRRISGYLADIGAGRRPALRGDEHILDANLVRLPIRGYDKQRALMVEP